MKLAVLGHQELGTGDLEALANNLVRFLSDPEVDEIFFAGTEGAGLSALAVSVAWRQKVTPAHRPIFTLVMPDKIETRLPWEQKPPLPWEWAPTADRVIELGNPLHAKDTFRGFHLLGEFLVDRVADCGQLLVFWNGKRLSATGRAVTYAQKRDIAWECVEIKGEE